MTIFLDLDNTILPSKEAYQFALARLPKDWESLELGREDSFLPQYEKARSKIKEQLVGHSSNRLRLLCFKEMVTTVYGSLNLTLIKKLLILEEKYYEYFRFYLREDLINQPEWASVFALLKKLEAKQSLIFLTNETLRTQLLKISAFFPEDLKFQLLTSEEVGKEKPNKDYFSHALRLTTDSAENCIMVGDNFDDDIIGATGVGMPAIFQTKRFGEKYPPKAYEELKGVLVSENLLSTLEYILQQMPRFENR